MAAEMAGGELTLQSELGKGTEVTARFVRSHIDRMPLGDMVGTMTALIRLNPQVDFVYRRCFNGREAVTDTRELRQVLGEVPLDTPEVMEWIDGYLREQEGCVTGTQPPSDGSRLESWKRRAFYACVRGKVGKLMKTLEERRPSGTRPGRK